MNRNARIAFLFSTAFLTFSAYPAWAGPPPNPTPSDACGDTAGGTNALSKNNIACDPKYANTAFGFNALTSNTTGAYNAAFGGGALLNNTTGYGNTANGANALYSNTTGGGNVANGGSALKYNTKGSGNVANGANALLSNTTGSYNVANGNLALYSNTTGSANSANGRSALQSNTTGNYNVANGGNALFFNTTGSNNSANGHQALFFNTTGFSNVANGAYALMLNTTGYSNVANGGMALYSNTTGNTNIAVGDHALPLNTVGTNNIAIGYHAGDYVVGGSNNIYLGNSSGDNLAGLGKLDESSTMRLGSVQTSTYIAGVYKQQTNNSAASVPVYIDSTGKLGTLPSSKRYKDDIRDMNEASRRLFELRPVTYHYKQPAADGSKPLEYGLIAEEVAKVYPDLVVRGKDGQIETVQYHKITPMLLNEVQHLSRALQLEKDKNLAQTEQLQAQANALKAEQVRNQAQETQIRLQGSQLLSQTQTIADIKRQTSIVQAQAMRMETLAARLANLETKGTMGLLANASEAK